MNGKPGTYGRPYPTHVAKYQRWLTTLHTLAYRLSGGRIGATLLGMPMLLLTTVGRRSGTLRTAPLLYLPVDQVFLLVGSNGGARYHPTWWLNLLSYPEALVQIGPVRGRVQAREATPAERSRFWPLLLRVYPTYDQYQARTDRPIPVIVLQPLDPELYSAVPARYQRHTSQAV